MRLVLFFCLAVVLQGCIATDDEIKIEVSTPDANTCINPLSDDEIGVISAKIESETFSDEKLKRAKFHARERCFLAYQVTLIMDAFVYESNKLEIAKFLYTKTKDRYNYDVVIDNLTYSSDRDELRNYMDSID